MIFAMMLKKMKKVKPWAKKESQQEFLQYQKVK
jgi:hypothetical protein